MKNNEDNDLNIKITNAMERIEALYNDTKGKCYLSFSGGKDSTVLLALIKMCEDIYTIPKNSIPAVFCNTGIELGATVDFVKWCKDNWYGNIQIIRPDKSFDAIVKEYGKPIKSKMKSEMLSRFQKSNDEETMSFCYLMGESKDGKKYSKTKLANKDMHLLHHDLQFKISNKCCEILKKKPFEKYAKQHNINGYIIGERMAEGGVRELNALKRLNGGGNSVPRLKVISL